MLLVFLSALAGLFIAVILFSETSFKLKAFEFSASLFPSLSGETVVVFPPLGKLRAATHLAPFLLEITLKNVDLDILSASLQELSALQDISFLQRELKEKLFFFTARQAAASFICSALITLILLRRGSRQIRRALICGLLSVLLLGLLLGGTLIYPYNTGAFANPRFEGALAAAPWIVSIAERALETAAIMSEQFELMALNLEDVSNRLQLIRPVSDSSEIRVLHVSDIHNNPAAFNLIEKVTASFQIDLVIDTGDLTDYGSELEAELAARMARLPVPYLFIPGNHDSPQIIELLRREGAIIISPEPVEIGGLCVAGLADPAAENHSAEVAEKSAMYEICLEEKKVLAGEGNPPDIFAVHNPFLAELFRGDLPLILSGHTHRAGIIFDEESGTVFVNAGTTGAAGVRGLLAPRDNPYSAAILYFNPHLDPGFKLTGADLISIDQFQDSFTLQRFYNRQAES